MNQRIREWLWWSTQKHRKMNTSRSERQAGPLSLDYVKYLRLKLPPRL
jgi:hypothetical protein